MTTTIVLSLLVALVGAIVHLVGGRGATLGLWAWGVGLLAFLLRFDHTIRW